MPDMLAHKYRSHELSANQASSNQGSDTTLSRIAAEALGFI